MFLDGSVPESARPIKTAAIPGILLECALGAVVQGFMVLFMGGIAVNILGGLLHDKIPSVPHGLSESIYPGAGTVAAWHFVWDVVKANRLWIISTVFFAHAIWTRLSPRSESKEQSRAAKRLSRAFMELSSNWFGLLIGNAFGASISAMVVMWASNFSVTSLLLNTVLGGFADWLTRVGAAVIGAGAVDTIHGLGSWYAANQFKFTFWLLFLAAMLDDLGLPNVKTLGRWLWRRFRRGMRPEPQPPNLASAQPPPSTTPVA